MRIAYFSDNFYPEITGITISVMTQGEELTKRGHSVVYVAPFYSKKDYAPTKHEDKSKITAQNPQDSIVIQRLPSLPLPFSPTGQSRVALPIGSSFSFLEEFKPDIIHTNSPYGTGIEAIRAARRLQVPLVGTNHTPIEEFYPWAPQLMRRFDRWYYNHCNFMSAPFEELITNMRAVGLTIPAHAVSNPTRLTRFAPAKPGQKQALREKLKLPGPTLLYNGRLAREKRVDVLIRGVAELIKEFPTLTLLATGSGAAETSLKKLTQELRLEQHVRFTGFVNTETLANLYKASDVFTFMSTSDSQSLSLMQAYASAVPGVCARSHGLPDYTPPSCGLLVEPGDYKAFAQKTAELLRDEPLREHMGAAAVEYVKQFTPEKIAEQWEKIYQEVIEKQK